MTERYRVAGSEDVSEDCGVLVEVGDKRIALFRYRDQFFAVDVTCPHRGAPLHKGSVEKGILTCPWHQWQFALETGCSPRNPLSCVKRYPVRVDANGLWVDL